MIVLVMSQVDASNGGCRWITFPVTTSNPRATKQDEIWNKQELPVMDWEDAEHRVVLPATLQSALGVNEPVLRWSRLKREQVLRAHSIDAPVIVNINMHLEDWRYCGREEKNTNLWRVLFSLNRRWYSVTVGRDATQSLNVITVFGSARSSFLRNRLRGIETIIEQQR